MKKILIGIFLAILLSPYPAFAGRIKGGFKLGFNFANQYGDDAMDLEPRLGYCGGIFTNIRLTKIFLIQSEFQFTMKGKGSSSLLSANVLRANYLELPVLFKITAIRDKYVSLNVLLGPSIGFLLNAEYYKSGGWEFGSSAIRDDLNDEFKKVDYGVAIGTGIEFTKKWGVINFEILRYTTSLVSAGAENDSGDHLDIRNGVVSTSIGFMFPGEEIIAVETETQEEIEDPASKYEL